MEILGKISDWPNDTGAEFAVTMCSGSSFCISISDKEEVYSRYQKIFKALDGK